jgi:hypothetical protein
MICSLQVNRLFHCRLSACLYNRCTAALVSTPDSFLRFAHITHLCPQYHPPLPTISPTFAHNINHLCPQYQPFALSCKMDGQAPKEPTLADHYAILGIPQYATMAHIKTAYRKMVLTHHPDKMAPGQTVDATDFRRVSDTPPSAQLLALKSVTGARSV